MLGDLKSALGNESKGTFILDGALWDAVGDEMQFLFSALGLGILLAVPTNMSASIFIFWSVSKTRTAVSRA